jgi:hypothetical protein
MKWYETDRFILVCFLLVLCEAGVGWVVRRLVLSPLIPADGIVIGLSKEDAEALASAIETLVMRPILEENARRVQRAQAEAWCRGSGFLLAGMTVPGFWLAFWATENPGAEDRRV